MLRKLTVLCLVVAAVASSAGGASRKRARRKRKPKLTYFGSVAIYNAYRFNRRVVEKKYGGKRIGVYGLVWNVIGDTVYLEVGEWEDHWIKCKFDKIPPAAQRYPKNLKVQIEGVLARWGEDGPELVNCQISSKRPKDISKIRPAWRGQAAELYWAFKNDPSDSKGRYRGKVVQIIGVLASSHREAGGGRPVLRFGPPEKFAHFYVECYLEHTHEPDKNRLKRGGACMVRGYCEGRERIGSYYGHVVLKDCMAAPR